MTPLQIQTPRVFLPLLKPARYKGVHGGRGSGKSHFFAEALVERCLMVPGTRAVCIREIQKSLAQSVKQLIEGKIQALGVGKHFDVTKAEIRTPGDGLIIFQGMQDHTAESIKSLEGYDIAYVEEAQSLTKRSLQLLRPTIRKKGSELWFAWNPRSDDDPVDKLFRGEGRLSGTDAICVQANWSDNPWFPQVLADEMAIDQERDPDAFDHVWNGAYETISEAIIFRNRVEVREFETPATVERFYYGADWGFANDPTVLLRCFIIEGEDLFVDHEAFGYHVELDDVADRVFDVVPGSRRWPIKADCAQPAQISYMRREGFRIAAADKWPGSVEDGVKHLKAFRRIVVHPRCVNLAQEFRLYSYKVDKQTGDVLPIIVDKHNHGIDACIAEGELVHTDRGQVQVEDVAVGDCVLTRAGFRRVDSAVMTHESADIWEVAAAGSVLRATRDHRVWTNNRGFVRIDALCYDDTLLVCVSGSSWLTSKHSNSWEKSTAATLRAITRLTGSISSLAGLVASTLHREVWRHHNGPIPSVITCTTGAGTSTTTTFPTWNASVAATISGGMSQNLSAIGGAAVRRLNTLRELGLLPKLGTFLQKARESAKKLARWHIWLLSRGRSNVSVVGRYSPQKNLAILINSVAMPANRQAEELEVSTARSALVSGAANHSRSIGTKKLRHVLARVRGVRFTGERRPVYDLSVEGQPEFFASGILVHNCRYALDKFIQRGRGMKISEDAIAEVSGGVTVRREIVEVGGAPDDKRRGIRIADAALGAVIYD